MTVNQELFRGDSFPVSIEVVSTSSLGAVAFDLTGYDVTVSLRWPNCQTLNLVSTALTIDSTAGTISGEFTVAQTSTLPDAMQNYLVLEIAGAKQTYFLGRVKVRSCGSSTETCFDG
jgi:hypothetical protein